jgi:hypothetical protein
MVQFVEYRHPGYRQDPVNIANSGCYRLQNREAMDMDVVRAVRLWYMPAGAEFAIELRPEENEARLGVGISCTEEVQPTKLFHILSSFPLPQLLLSYTQ